MARPPNHQRTIAASLVALSVFLYITVACGLRLDLGQFVACAVLLSLALAILVPSGSRPGPGRTIIEGFDSMVSMTTDMIVPHLDRLIIKLANGDAKKSHEEPKTTTIDKGWFDKSGVPVADADLDATKLAYKRIKLLLCLMSEADPDKFASMMKALGAPPVETEAHGDGHGHGGGGSEGGSH